MQLSPSWEAANCAATQEFPIILWKSKVHYRVHMSPSLLSTLGQINSVHTTPPYLSRIILPYVTARKIIIYSTRIFTFLRKVLKDKTF
jgi:hypothetical protein